MTHQIQQSLISGSELWGWLSLLAFSIAGIGFVPRLRNRPAFKPEELSQLGPFSERKIQGAVVAPG